MSQGDSIGDLIEMENNVADSANNDAEDQEAVEAVVTEEKIEDKPEEKVEDSQNDLVREEVVRDMSTIEYDKTKGKISGTINAGVDVFNYTIDPSRYNKELAITANAGDREYDITIRRGSESPFTKKNMGGSTVIPLGRFNKCDIGLEIALVSLQAQKPILEKMLADRESQDIVFVCDDSVEVSAHSAVMAQVSDRMRKSITRTKAIAVPCSGTVMKDIISYYYIDTSLERYTEDLSFFDVISEFDMVDVVNVIKPRMFAVTLGNSVCFVIHFQTTRFHVRSWRGSSRNCSRIL